MQVLNQLLTTSPLKFPPETYRKAYVTFLERFHFQKIEKLILHSNNDDPLKTISFEIDSSDLIDFDPWIAFNTFEHPKLLIKIFEESIKLCQESLIQSQEFKKRSKNNAAVKVNVQVRFVNLPPTRVYNKQLIGEIEADDVGRLIQLTGTIVKISPIKLLEVSKLYECKRSRCAHRFRVYADPEQNFQLPQPRKCPSSSSGHTAGDSNSGATDSKDGGISTKACQSVEFLEMEGSKVCVDFQEIKIQDKIESLKPGMTPKNLTCVISGNLVDRFNPGDSVVVIGYLIRQWRWISRNERCILKTTLLTNNIFSRNTSIERSAQNHDFKSWSERFTKYWTKNRHNVFTGRDFIVKSFCPQLYGMYYTKLAVLLTLVGGSESTGNKGDNKPGNGTVSGNKRQDSMKIRTQPHLLIVGDPGCGKSQILRFIKLVCPRVVLTSGIGTTGAGLTCSVTRDGNDWSIEAGALVLANGGVCCIDEFSSIANHDRAVILEAMEQQTISIAKAGVVSQLEARTTVIATCNPKGIYDLSLDLSTNTAISTPLLSRFDLTLVLLDRTSKEWDQKISTYLLQSRLSTTASKPTISTIQQSVSDDIWDTTTLREYIQYAKTQHHPKMSVLASHLVMKYFYSQRQVESSSATKATTRLLESLIRLSQAHAKLLLQDEVLLHDAVTAIFCVSLSQTENRMSTEFSLNGVLQSEFPADSRVNYDKIESDVFKALGITKDKFSEEVHSLGDKKAPSNTEDLLILEPSSSNKSRRLNEDTSYDYTSTATNTSELLTAAPPSTGTLRNVNPTSGFQSSSSDGRGSAWNVERGEYISEYSGRLDDRNTTKTSLGHWLPKASINVNIPSQNPMNQLYSSHSVGRQDVILNQGTDTSSERHVDYNFPSDPSDTHQSAKLDVWTDALQQTSSAPKVEVKQKQVKLQLHKIEDEDW